MLRLFKIEFRKLRTNKSFFIFTLIYFLSITGLAWVLGGSMNFDNFDLNLGDLGVFNFPGIWQNLTYVAAFFKIILAIIILTFITNEFEYRTIRQNVIDGLSKKEFLASKFIMILAISFVSTIYITIVTLIIGLTQSSFTEFDIIIMNSSFIIAYFVKLVSFFTLIMMIAIILKKTGFSLASLFIWAVVVEPILKWKVLPENLGRFLPLEAMANLIHEPFSKITNADKIIGNTTYSTVDPIDIIINIVYITIFLYVSYTAIKRRDL